MHQDEHAVVKFKVVLSFVDDTYWERISRYTRRTQWFDTMKDLAKFCKRVLHKGYEFDGRDGSGVARLSQSDMWVYRVSTVEMDLVDVLEWKTPKKTLAETGFKGQAGQ